MQKMQVILIQDVNNLGGANELVNVKNGYGRNFLIPHKLAVEANPSNLKQLEESKKQLAKKEEKLLAEINSVVSCFAGISFENRCKNRNKRQDLWKCYFCSDSKGYPRTKRL